jgi:EAL domain-containing protein (putative c-di-GMP-specific phosphodiesterase class I)
VAVNLSARSVYDRDLPETVASILAECGAEPSLLELELTETCLLADIQRARILLEKLQELGVRVAIDDFGTGYSSLAYLKHLPVRQLKIDRSVVQQVSRGSTDAAIVRATIELGHSLGLAVVAEGVEDVAGWHFLSELGCDEAQGFLIARPVPADQLLDWLLSSNSERAA